jgi:tetratricopeptide (TPR) repeat protein
MSYINDALRKAQKENKLSWTTDSGIASSEGKKIDTWHKGYTILGLSLVFLFAAGMMTLLYWPEIQIGRRSAPVISEPLTAIVTPVEAQISQDPPQVHEQLMPEPEVSSGLNAPAAADIAPPAIRSQALPAEVKRTGPEEALPSVKRHEKPEERLPADSKSLFTQALQSQRGGKLEEAKELYRQVLKKEPQNIQALNNLGVVYLKMNRYKWAIIRFNDALNIKHDYVDAHYNLACLYARKKDTQKSLFYLQNAIHLNPEVKTWAAGDADLKGLEKLPDFQNLIQARDN